MGLQILMEFCLLVYMSNIVPTSSNTSFSTEDLDENDKPVDTDKEDQGVHADTFTPKPLANGIRTNQTFLVKTTVIQKLLRFGSN